MTLPSYATSANLSEEAFAFRNMLQPALRAVSHAHYKVFRLLRQVHAQGCRDFQPPNARGKQLMLGCEEPF